MTREELFLNTLEDMRNRLSTNKVYDLLMTAALLRKLLLDLPSLISIVKRGRQRRIWFTIGSAQPYAGAVLWVLGGGLNPIHNTGHIKQVSLDDFLATTVIQVEGRDITIKDIIRHVSHISGSVHAGTPTEEADLILAEVNHIFQVGGADSTTFSLRAINEVVLTALADLESLIKEEFKH